MAKRKAVNFKNAHNFNEYVKVMKELVEQYSIDKFDIETTRNNYLGVELWVIQVYKR